MLSCISPKCKTILLIQEAIKVETPKLMSKSKKAILLKKTALTHLTELGLLVKGSLDILFILKNNVMAS